MNATLVSGARLAKGHAMASGRADSAELIARLERLPITRPVLWARGCVGMATFFDGYTTIALAYALPILSRPSSSGGIVAAWIADGVS